MTLFFDKGRRGSSYQLAYTGPEAELSVWHSPYLEFSGIPLSKSPSAMNTYMDLKFCSSGVTTCGQRKKKSSELLSLPRLGLLCSPFSFT